MNSLEQIPEEKENIDCLSKVPQSNPIPKQVLGLSNKALTINYSSVNTNKPLSHAGMKKVLSPQNQNGFSKLNTKSKSQNFSFKAIRAMPPVAVPEPATIEELEDQLEALILHQKTCQKDSKYVEAEMAKNRVQELKLLLEKRTKEDIKSRHTREMNEIQKAYLDEMDQFNAFWDNKIAEYDGDSTKIEQECVQKQDQEMDNFINDLDKSLEIRPKDNAEILNLRKIEVELAKKEDYMQAYAIKMKLVQLEKEETEKYSYERQKRMKNLISQLKAKHTTELQSLQKRIQAGKDEQVRLRSVEFERLLQKFMIAKKDLQQSQTNEINQFSKSVKIGSVILASKQANQSQMSNASFQKNLAILQNEIIIIVQKDLMMSES